MEGIMNQYDEVEIRHIIGRILKDYDKQRAIDKMQLYNQPDKEAIVDIVNKLVGVVYPGYYRDRSYKVYDVKTNVCMMIEDVMFRLNKQINRVLPYDAEYAHLSDEERAAKSQELTNAFFKKIPQIREYLDTDLQAILDGDPAASSKDEIVFAYPGFFAITVFRLAHELFLLKVPMIPRIMTEHAHSLTGIDIHPGATVGKYFFIDHGTGIVIGETTVIGEHVKLYQGVTLGALSTRGGQKLKGVRRHPTIGDNVTIYAGASVLGGESVIGKDCVIGSNVFITSSIPEGTSVSVKSQELRFKQHGSTPAVESELEQTDHWFYII
jgi:serine O-acetyltransferase